MCIFNIIFNQLETKHIKIKLKKNEELRQSYLKKKRMKWLP